MKGCLVSFCAYACVFLCSIWQMWVFEADADIFGHTARAKSLNNQNISSKGQIWHHSQIKYIMCLSRKAVWTFDHHTGMCSSQMNWTRIQNNIRKFNFNVRKASTKSDADESAYVTLRFHWMHVHCVTAPVWFCSVIRQPRPTLFWIRHDSALPESWSCKTEEFPRKLNNHMQPHL